MRGMPLWLFSMRVRQLIVHPENVPAERNEILACCNRLGIVMDAWRYAWRAPRIRH